MTAAVTLTVTIAIALALAAAVVLAATLRAGGTAAIAAAAAGVPIAGITGGIRRTITGVSGIARRAAITATAIAVTTIAVTTIAAAAIAVTITAATIAAATIAAAAITAATAAIVTATGRTCRRSLYADDARVGETGQILNNVSWPWSERQSASRHKKGDGQNRYSFDQLLSPHGPTGAKPGRAPLDLIREWAC